MTVIAGPCSKVASTQQQVTYAPDPAVVQTYRQAQGNCLTSRGYQVQY